jgi:hypothetical protein
MTGGRDPSHNNFIFTMNSVFRNMRSAKQDESNGKCFRPKFRFEICQTRHLIYFYCSKHWQTICFGSSTGCTGSSSSPSSTRATVTSSSPFPSELSSSRPTHPTLETTENKNVTKKTKASSFHFGIFVKKVNKIRSKFDKLVKSSKSVSYQFGFLNFLCKAPKISSHKNHSINFS